MISYTKQDLETALGGVGLEAGGTVLLSVQLSPLGRLTEATSRETFLRIYEDVLFDILGPDGTLVVHTYTTQTARFGRPYIHEETKCINGMLPQYFLEKPSSIRSLHPVNSFAAIGPRAREICTGNSGSNYGVASPPDRLRDLNATVVIVGMEMASCVLMHHLETTIGVPYTYNKLLDVPVFVDGSRVDRWFTANVRYLEFDTVYELGDLRQRLRDQEAVRSAQLGGGWVHAYRAQDYVRVAGGILSDDPFGLLAEVPPFEKGRIPFDGPTAERDGVAEAGTFMGAYDFDED